MGGNGAEPRGDGRSGDVAAELSVPHVVQAILELDTSSTRMGEKVIPTKVVVLAPTVKDAKDCLAELRSSGLVKVPQVGATGVEVVAGTPLSLISSVEKWGTDVSAVSGMVVCQANEFRQTLANEGSAARSELIAHLSNLGLYMPTAYSIIFIWPGGSTPKAPSFLVGGPHTILGGVELGVIPVYSDFNAVHSGLRQPTTPLSFEDFYETQSCWRVRRALRTALVEEKDALSLLECAREEAEKRDIKAFPAPSGDRTALDDSDERPIMKKVTELLRNMELLRRLATTATLRVKAAEWLAVYAAVTDYSDPLFFSIRYVDGAPDQRSRHYEVSLFCREGFDFRSVVPGGMQIVVQGVVRSDEAEGVSEEGGGGGGGGEDGEGEGGVSRGGGGGGGGRVGEEYEEGGGSGGGGASGGGGVGGECTAWSLSEGVIGGSARGASPSAERDVAGGPKAGVAAGETPAASAGREPEGGGGEGGGGGGGGGGQGGEGGEAGEQNTGGGLSLPNGEATNRGWASGCLLSSSRQASGGAPRGKPVSSDIAPDCGSDVGTGGIGGERGSGEGDSSRATSRPLDASSTTRSTHMSGASSEGVEDGIRVLGSSPAERGVAEGSMVSVATSGVAVASAGREPGGEGGGEGWGGEGNAEGRLLRPNRKAASKGWARGFLLSSPRQASGGAPTVKPANTAPYWESDGGSGKGYDCGKPSRPLDASSATRSTNVSEASSAGLWGRTRVWSSSSARRGMDEDSVVSEDTYEDAVTGAGGGSGGREGGEAGGGNVGGGGGRGDVEGGMSRSNGQVAKIGWGGWAFAIVKAGFWWRTNGEGWVFIQT